jgi:hypothetical protein
MTLPEILRLMAEDRREHPAATELHEDQVARTRAHRYQQIKAIGVEHNLPRSYSTIEECRRLGQAVFAGSRMIRSETVPGTTRPGQITSLEPSNVVYRFHGRPTPVQMPDGETARAHGSIHNSAAASKTGLAAAPKPKSKRKPDEPVPPTQTTAVPKAPKQLLPRPKNLKVLE